MAPPGPGHYVLKNQEVNPHIQAPLFALSDIYEHKKYQDESPGFVYQKAEFKPSGKAVSFGTNIRRLLHRKHSTELIMKNTKNVNENKFDVKLIKISNQKKLRMLKYETAKNARERIFFVIHHLKNRN